MPNLSSPCRRYAAAGVAGAAAVLVLATAARAEIMGGPAYNPATNHLYYLLSPQDWHAADAEAQAWGGHLVSFTDQAENDWASAFVDGHFGGYRSYWAGLNDVAAEGQWVWSSGEPVTFTNWRSGEPNNSGDEDGLEVIEQGRWNDSRTVNVNHAVAEFAPPGDRVGHDDVTIGGPTNRVGHGPHFVSTGAAATLDPLQLSAAAAGGAASVRTGWSTGPRNGDSGAGRLTVAAPIALPAAAAPVEFTLHAAGDIRVLANAHLSAAAAAHVTIKTNGSTGIAGYDDSHLHGIVQIASGMDLNHADSSLSIAAFDASFDPTPGEHVRVGGPVTIDSIQAVNIHLYDNSEWDTGPLTVYASYAEVIAFDGARFAPEALDLSPNNVAEWSIGTLGGAIELPSTDLIFQANPDENLTIFLKVEGGAATFRSLRNLYEVEIGRPTDQERVLDWSSGRLTLEDEAGLDVGVNLGTASRIAAELTIPNSGTLDVRALRVGTEDTGEGVLNVGTAADDIAVASSATLVVGSQGMIVLGVGALETNTLVVQPGGRIIGFGSITGAVTVGGVLGSPNSPDELITLDGTLSGTGTLGGTIEVTGDQEVHPGDAGVGVLAAQRLTLSDATLVFELAAAGHDQLILTDLLTINTGWLRLELVDGYVPVGGAQFQLIDLRGGSISGVFADDRPWNLPALPDDLAWDLSRLESDGVVEVIPEPATAAAFAAVPLLLARRRRPCARSRPFPLVGGWSHRGHRGDDSEYPKT